MAYTDFDYSTDAGAPYELFEFTEGSRAWRYTTRPVATVFAGQTYAPAVISRGAVVREASAIGDDQTILLPDTDALALELYAGLTMHQVAVTIRQVHLADTDAQARVLFVGLVTGVSFEGATATISCGPRYALASKRRIAPTTYQAGCNLTWGSPRCGVNSENYRVNATVTSGNQSGRTLTVAALAGYAAGHFNGGRVVVGTQVRFIERHAAGGVLTLSYPLGAFGAAAIYPDCQKNEAACIAYGNLPNYLGWSRLPSINPYNRSAYYLDPATAIAPPVGAVGDLPGHPGYKVWLPGEAVEWRRAMRAEAAGDRHVTTLTFTPTGYLQVRFESLVTLTSREENSGFVVRHVFEPHQVDTSAGAMWVSPRPAPGFGDVEFRVDVARPDFPAVPGRPDPPSTRVGEWFDPAVANWCAIGISEDAAFPRLIGDELWRVVVATVRVRNRTTGVVIAQGDLTLRYLSPYPNPNWSGG